MGATRGIIFLKSPSRPIVHVEDISRAFIAALEAPGQLVSVQAFQCRTQCTHLPRELRQNHAGVISLSSRVSDSRRGAKPLYDAYRRSTLKEFEGPRDQRNIFRSLSRTASLQTIVRHRRGAERGVTF
jgi:hypothetical protein